MCISHVIKKSDTCHFYKLGWRRFLQPSLEENFVLSLLLFVFFFGSSYLREEELGGYGRVEGRGRLREKRESVGDEIKEEGKNK
jgi:hypothetical protein